MNYIVSYDLNGAAPSHRQMDELFARIGASRGRILETVWFVKWAGTQSDLFNAINQLLSPNDRLVVVDARDMVFRNLLVSTPSVQQAWAA